MELFEYAQYTPPETYVRTIYEIVDKLRDRKIINV